MKIVFWGVIALIWAILILLVVAVVVLAAVAIARAFGLL